MDNDIAVLLWTFGICAFVWLLGWLWTLPARLHGRRRRDDDCSGWGRHG